MVISIDITDLKQVESKLRTKERVFDTSIAANSIADPKGIITEVNSAFLKTWGFSNEDEVLGKTISYFLQSEEKAAEIIETLNKSGVWEDNFIAKKKDGSTFIAHSVATTLRNEKGEMIGYQSSVFDITERDQAMRVLKKSSEQLRKSNEELEQFAYISSHDLQEPLRVVSSYCQLIRDKYYEGMDEDGKKYVDYIISSAMRMKTLIKELLDYSRIGRKEELFEKINLQDLLEEVLSDFHILIEDTGAEIIIECDMPNVMAIRFRIKQLFHNIISNSLKFRSDKKPIIRIGCCEDSKDMNHWLFYVKDNGIGIDSKYYERIFGVFKRLYSREEYPGTGIGLALCKKIVEAHGGRIWVESENREGTYVYFTISKSWDIF
jgi:PAS domain S-box-containing protein